MQQQELPGYASDMGDYEPELDPNQNPHYYQMNGVLYQAHLARKRRVHRSNNLPP